MADIARLVSTITQPTFRQRNIDPGGELYVQRDEDLQLQVLAITDITSVEVFIRLRQPDGTILYRREFSKPPAAAPIAWSARWRIGDNFLLGVSVYHAGPALDPGELYIQARIVGAGDAIVIDLLADYVTVQHHPSWPPGTFRLPAEGPGALLTITQANPAAGQPVEITVPYHTRWDVRSVRCFFVTSAAAGNRRVRIELAKSGAYYFQWPDGAVHGPSTTQQYIWATTGVAGFSTPQRRMNPLPQPTRVQYGDVIRIVAEAMDAGDQFSFIFLGVEQWAIWT